MGILFPQKNQNRMRLLLLVWLAGSYFIGYGQSRIEDFKLRSNVTDATGLLDSIILNRLSNELKEFQDTYGQQLVILITDVIPSGYSLAEFSQELGNRYRIGNPEINDGIFYVIYLKNISEQQTLLKSGYSTDQLAFSSNDPILATVRGPEGEAEVEVLATIFVGKGIQDVFEAVRDEDQGKRLSDFVFELLGGDSSSIVICFTSVNYNQKNRNNNFRSGKRKSYGKPCV